MFKISNAFIGLLNFLTLIISFPVISMGLWFRMQAAGGACESFLQTPLLAVGGFLFVVSLLGFFGACCRVSALLWIYLVLLFLLILATITFTMLTLIVTSKGVGETIYGVGFKEYRLGDYSHWLQKKVRDPENWKVIEGCLRKAKVCSKFKGEIGMKADVFYKRNLSPLQSGCCKPPTSCEFKYVNATFWEVPKGKDAGAADEDCRRWSNDQKKLCWNCHSCKAGFLEILKKRWKKIAILNSAILVLLIFLYSVGCCAFKNSRARPKHW